MDLGSRIIAQICTWGGELSRVSNLDPPSNAGKEISTTFPSYPTHQQRNAPSVTVPPPHSKRSQYQSPNMSEMSPENCPFCAIGATYTPSPATHNYNPELLSPSAFVVLSTPLCVAFLDIMPLSPGHLLVTTRRHREKVSDITVEESRELGQWLPILSRVLAKTLDVWDWNIVQNNGAAAAQVVPHVHFHIIPRPALTPELRNRSFTMFGRGQRSEIDDEEAIVLSQKLREELERELEAMEGAKL